MPRRFKPRLRWSLRTMLAAVALVAALCAWYVQARQRADEQEALIAIVGRNWGRVYTEGWGPGWLDLVGARRLRQRIVGAEFREFPYAIDELDLFRRLSRLPNLRYLVTEPVFSPTAESLIGEMRHLQTLGIYCRSKANDQVVTLTAVGRLTRLERLNASVWVASAPNLEPLTRLTSLKSLALEIRNEFDGREGLEALGKLAHLERLSLRAWRVRGADLAYLTGLPKLKSLTIQSIEELNDASTTRGPDGQPDALADFPALARLEALDLTEIPLANADLGRLAVCPRLKSLYLRGTGVGDAGLAGLAAVEYLKELAIDEYTLTAAGIESLARLKNLQALHVANIMDEEYEDDDEWASIVLDDQQKLDVLSSGLDRLGQALEAVRRAHPGIVIDTDCDGFRERTFPDTFELRPPSGWQQAG